MGALIGCMPVYCLMPGARGDQKRVSGTLELEFLMVVGIYVGAGNGARLLKE